MQAMLKMTGPQQVPTSSTKLVRYEMLDDSVVPFVNWAPLEVMLAVGTRTECVETITLHQLCVRPAKS